MTGYARGDYAMGECARSGRKMRLRDMVEDGRYPGLMVDPHWREDKHPNETLPSVSDPQALENPALEQVRQDLLLRFPRGNPMTGQRGADLFKAFAFAHDLNADTFKVALFTSRPGDIYSTDGEMQASGYTTGGMVLAGEVSDGEFVLAPSVWPGVSFNCSWLLIYNAETWQGLLRVDAGAPAISKRGEFRIHWPSVMLLSDAGQTRIERVRF